MNHHLFSATLRGLLGCIRSRLAAARRHAAARREFQRLDTGTLRDLGLAPSEFGSYWAEANGLAEPTRLRVQASAATQRQ
jgi:uncharacterized protein YjiS (DUF1127 family)